MMVGTHIERTVQRMPYGGRFKVPSEIYHAVPPGWGHAEMFRTHQALGGSFDITGAEAMEAGSPDCTPEWLNWRKYKATLYKIVDGVNADDPACVEMAVRYIELGYIGSYSGYLRASFARALSRATLQASQIERLVRVFQTMVDTRDYMWEFKAYRKLWRRKAPPAPV
jgi:hypothetical protein